jgi:hypothetical protein
MAMEGERESEGGREGGREGERERERENVYIFTYTYIPNSFSVL